MVNTTVEGELFHRKKQIRNNSFLPPDVVDSCDFLQYRINYYEVSFGKEFQSCSSCSSWCLANLVDRVWSLKRFRC